MASHTSIQKGDCCGCGCNGRKGRRSTQRRRRCAQRQPKGRRSRGTCPCERRRGSSKCECEKPCEQSPCRGRKQTGRRHCCRPRRSKKPCGRCGQIPREPKSYGGCGCGCGKCRCKPATTFSTSPDCNTCSNAFMNFLSAYRRKCGNYRNLVSVAAEAGRAWHDMTDTEREQYNYKSPSGIDEIHTDSACPNTEGFCKVVSGEFYTAGNDLMDMSCHPENFDDTETNQEQKNDQNTLQSV